MSAHGCKPMTHLVIPPERLSVFSQPPPFSLCAITSCLHQIVLASHQQRHEPFHSRQIENHFKWWKDTLAHLFFPTFVTFFFPPKKGAWIASHTLTSVLFCETQNEWMWAASKTFNGNKILRGTETLGIVLNIGWQNSNSTLVRCFRHHCAMSPSLMKLSGLMCTREGRGV